MRRPFLPLLSVTMTTPCVSAAGEAPTATTIVLPSDSAGNTLDQHVVDGGGIDLCQRARPSERAA